MAVCALSAVDRAEYPEAVEGLMDAFSNPDPMVRRAAVLSFRYQNEFLNPNARTDPILREGLLERLADDDDRGRDCAAVILSPPFDPPGFPLDPLVDALSDEDEEIWKAAAEALARAGDSCGQS